LLRLRVVRTHPLWVHLMANCRLMRALSCTGSSWTACSCRTMRQRAAMAAASAALAGTASSTRQQACACRRWQRYAKLARHQLCTTCGSLVPQCAMAVGSDLQPRVLHHTCCWCAADLAHRGRSAAVLCTLGDVPAACKAAGSSTGQGWNTRGASAVHTWADSVAAARGSFAFECSAACMTAAIGLRVPLSSVLCCGHSLVFPAGGCCPCLVPQEHCCFVDVHGTIVSAVDLLPAAIQAAAASSSKPSGNSSLLEADHVLNPDKQDTPGGTLCGCVRAQVAETKHNRHKAHTVAANHSLPLLTHSLEWHCTNKQLLPAQRSNMCPLAPHAVVSLQGQSWQCCMQPLAVSAGRTCTQH
jgi:hypothetical protein